MIEKWKDELEKKSFIFKKWSAREISFLRYQRFFRQHIWDETRNSEGGTCVNTFINIKDPFCDDPIYEHVVLLGGRLSIDRVVLPELGQGSCKFWAEKEKANAFVALLKYGLPWLEENSNAQKLIDRFEKGLREGVSWEDSKESHGLLTRFAEYFLFRHGKRPDNRSRRPPIYHHYLTLLYYHIGNKDMACAHANEWLKYCQKPGVPPPGEPARTIRQLSNMGCQ